MINFIYALTIIIFSAATIRPASSAQEVKTISLGQSAAFAGSSRSLGVELWRGSQAYFDEVNLRGGINGHQIKVLALDDGYIPNRALLNTIKLVKTENVFALYGFVGTPTIVKVLPALQKLSQEHDIFLFSSFTGAQPQRSSPHLNHIFSVRSSYRQETKALIDQLVKLGHKRFGLFLQNDAYGRSGADGVARALKQYGLDIVLETNYLKGATYHESMDSQVQSMIKNKVDAIISVGSYQAGAAFIRDARLAGLHIPIANISFVGSDQLLTLLRESEQELKIDLTSKLLNSQVVPPWSDTSIKVVAEYQELMQKHNPQYRPLDGPSTDLSQAPVKFNFVSLEGFINAKLLVEILKNYFKQGYKELDRKKVRDFIQVPYAYDIGLEQPLKLASDNNQFIDHVYLTEVSSNGEFQIVTDWSKFAKPQDSSHDSK